ncbi:MAG: GNAT family N-acetyltransferase [Solimonas sp.]
MINYRSDRRPEAAAIAALYRSSPLNRPVDDVARIGRMYEGSNIVITAWDAERLVGILRGWTDFAYDGYVCDLAIAPDCQKSGIGRALLDQALAINPEVQRVLRASKIAANYYEHIGWQKIENGWMWPRKG